MNSSTTRKRARHGVQVPIDRTPTIRHGIAWCWCGRMLRPAGAALRCLNGHEARAA